MTGPVAISKPGSTFHTAQNRTPPEKCFEGENPKGMMVTRGELQWEVKGEDSKEQLDGELDRAEGEEEKREVEEGGEGRRKPSDGYQFSTRVHLSRSVIWDNGALCIVIISTVSFI